MTRQRCAPTRRELLQGGLALAGLGLLSGCAVLPIAPQRQARLPRVGYLTGGGDRALADGFRLGLADHGYVEGQNIVVEWRDAEGRSDRLPGLAAQAGHLQLISQRLAIEFRAQVQLIDDLLHEPFRRLS